MTKPLTLSILLLCLLVSGCGAGRAGSASPAAPSAKTSAHALAAPAGRAVAEPMRPFFAAGLAFVVAGGVLLAFGVRGTGGMLLTLGVATTGVGVLFVQYPWAVLLLLLCAGGVASYAAWDRIRARRELAANREALAATTQVIQNVPEGEAIKKALAGLGGDIEAKVREAVTPIKDALRRAGKIS